ncbi:MAG: hypothetical protein JOZ57_09865, partial [Abitibacteriaceae bacterium]|nr:hypothetical protein [Abditibacteriaceae bacterium]
ALDTLTVDENGTGTVVPRVNQLQIKGDMLGQKLILNVQDGNGSFTMNGKAMAGGDKANWGALSNPALAMRISKFGKIEGFVPNPGQTTPPTQGTPTTAPAPTDDAKARAARAAGRLEAPAGKKPQGAGLPLDLQGILSAMMLRALPTLWPDHEVNAGDKWTTDLNWPLPAKITGDGAAPDAAAAPQFVPLGKFDMTLRGEEEVAGRKTQRIAVKGMVDIDEKTAAALAQSVPPQLHKAGAAKANAPALQHSKQQFSGDLWFDASAGQLVRVEMDVQSLVTAHNVGGQTANGQKKNAQAKPNPDEDSAMAFNGTLQMQLRKVSYATANATNSVPNTTVASADGGAVKQ